MTYEVIIENAAQKDFKRLVSPWDEAIKKAVSGLELNPRPHGVKKLSGSKDGYRIRVGDFRVLFAVDDRKRVVAIFRVRHRSEVYR
jgi:mRNA interferase RelE/StbE